MNILYRSLGQFIPQKHELSPSEAIIPWLGHLKFRTYNPWKIKYRVLARVVSEVVSGCICNLVIYSAEGKKLEDTVLSFLDGNLAQNHQIY